MQIASYDCDTALTYSCDCSVCMVYAGTRIDCDVTAITTNILPANYIGMYTMTAHE